MSGVEAAHLVDDLYRRSIEVGVAEHDLETFMSEAGAVVGEDREFARPLRRAARMARKLSTYWRDSDPGALPDWRNGVDEALGSRGWEPQLDLVRHSLEVAPDAGAFDEMKDRHRAVHFTPWMDGIAFEEWAADRE